MTTGSSLAGVAGLIVAIGFTADSFIVYFERIRDELRDGRRPRRGRRGGLEARAARSSPPRRSTSSPPSCSTSLAVGNVRGFAFTLGLTTLIDLIVVYPVHPPGGAAARQTKFFGEGHRLSGLDPTRSAAALPGRAAVSAARHRGRRGRRRQDRQCCQGSGTSPDHRRASQAAAAASATKHDDSARRIH